MNTEKSPRVLDIKLFDLFKEILLLIIMIYLVIIGGTYNGMVLYTLQLTNLVLAGCLGVAGGIWLIWQVHRNRLTLKTPLDLALMIWLGVVALACIFSTNPRLSWEIFVQSLVLVLFFYLVVVLIRTGWPEDLWIKTLLISSGVVVFFGLVELALWYAGWFKIGGWADLLPPATYRVRATLGHPNIAAAYLNLILPLGLAVFVKTTHKLNRWILVVLIGLILGLVFFTSSRGGWLGTAAAVGSFGLLYILDNPEKIRNAYLWMLKRPVILAGLILVIITGFVLGTLLLYRQMQHPSHPGLSNPVDARNYIWSVAFSMFQQRPVLGMGPQTFGGEFIRKYSYPPSMLLAHSHNYLLNSLAEMGGLGVVSVLFLGSGLILAAVRRWRSCPTGERTILSGVMASLIGLSIHSQFDTPETVLLINLVAAILIGMLIAPLTSNPVRHASGKPGFKIIPAILWCIGLAVFLCMQGFAFQAAFLFDRGLRASSVGDWPLAARLIDAAAAKDSNLAHYWFQSGIAHSELVFKKAEEVVGADQTLADLLLPVKDQSELTNALISYQKGLAIDDSNATYWANLGILQWSVGDRLEGIASVERAGSLAPGSSVFRLLLGWMYEQTAQTQNAKEAYAKALSLSPEYQNTPFFSNSHLRKDLVVKPAVLSGGWGYLSIGDYMAAEKVFRNEAGLNNTQAYRGLGIALMGQNRYDEAEKALLTANFIEPNSLETHLALETLYKQMGIVAKSEAAGQIIKMLKSQPVQTGPQKQSDPDYAYYIYHKETLLVRLAGMASLE